MVGDCYSTSDWPHDCDSATKWRQGVAMGVSPWKSGCRWGLSPSGATQNHGHRIRVAPLGLGHVGDANHGLTPMATTCRPFGTESQGQSPRLVAELHAQFAESAKLERAIKANLKGRGYGG